MPWLVIIFLVISQPETVPEGWPWNSTKDEASNLKARDYSWSGDWKLLLLLLLTQFWPNFKSRYLGTSTTDFSCHSDICPGNISPGDVCPYQQYLSSYWPNFLAVLIFVGNFFFFLDRTSFIPTHPPPPHKLNISNISALTDPIFMKL